MRDLENQDYLNIIKSDCVRITDIRTEDDLKLSLGELDDIILGAESIEANEFCEDNQQYCIACIYHEKLVAIDIANITNDKCFFYYAFIGEIYDYEKLIIGIWPNISNYPSACSLIAKSLLDKDVFNLIAE